MRVIKFPDKNKLARNRAKVNNLALEGGNFVQVRYLSVNDIVKMTGKPKKTVQGWCRNGLLPASKPAGRDYFIKEEDFQAFMERGAVKTS